MSRCPNCERKDRNILRQQAAIKALQTRVDMAESQAAHAMKQLRRLWWYAEHLPVPEHYHGDTVVCENCKLEFVPRRRDAKYCYKAACQRERKRINQLRHRANVEQQEK